MTEHPHKAPSLKQEPKLKTRAQRSKSFPWEESHIVELPQPMPSFEEQEKDSPVEVFIMSFTSRQLTVLCCAKTSLCCHVVIVCRKLGSNRKFLSPNYPSYPPGLMFPFVVVSQQAEEAVLCDSTCDSACDSSCDKTSVQLPATDGDITANKEERKRQSVTTVSIEVQTDAITDEELLSLQQQKM